MLLTMFIVMKWITQVIATSNEMTLTLTFTDKDKVEYKTSRKSVSESDFIVSCRHFNEINTAVIDKNTIAMCCSSQTFSIIDRLLGDGDTVSLEDIVGEFTLNVVYELLEALEPLLYKDNVKGLIYERLIEHILPRIVFSVTSEEQRDEYIENNKKCTEGKIENQIKLIFPLYLQRYHLGICVEENIAVLYKDDENKNQEEILNSIEVSGIKILPGVLNNDIKEKVKTNEEQRLGILLWMFDICYEEVILDLSGYVLTNGQMGQLSAMEGLTALNLSKCSVNLDEGYNWIGTGFKALEELDISGVKLENAYTRILYEMTGLKKLKMEKCFIRPEINLEFIKKQKKLEELRIGGNNLSEEHLNIIFSHEGIKTLDMYACSVERMYIYGGKIENLDVLKIFNDGKISIEENIIRITLPETNDESHLEKLEAYNGCSIFFGNNGNTEVSLQKEEKVVSSVSNVPINGTEPTALINRSETFQVTKKLRLSGLNGCLVFFKKNIREIKIIFSQTSKILKKLNEFKEGKVCFIGKEGEKINFLDASKSKAFMKNVEGYNCGQVCFEDKQVEMIFSHKELKRLSMSRCGLKPKTIVKIKDKNKLEELELNNNKIDSNSMTHIIENCRNLKKLNVSHCGITVKGNFKNVPKLENLEELNIGWNVLNEKCLEYILNHKWLLRLNIACCQLVENSLDGINELKELKELYIGNNNIGMRDLESIFMLRELEILSIPNIGLFENRKKGYVDIIGIITLKKLKILNIKNNKMPKGDIDFIFMIEGLKELEIENCNLKEGCLENIHRLKSLERLNIGRNAINKSDMDAIVSIKVLRELRMSYCDVTDNVAFLNIKCLNNSLMLFDASGCSLSKENMSKLVNLTNLRELRLVSKLSVDILSKVLSKLTRLRALYLGPIDTRKFIASRCFPLMSLSTLEILELDFINIKNEFIEWLGRLPNLKELAFECTSIPHKDEIPIFNIAEFPRSLRKLKITGNRCYSLNFNASGKQDGLVIFENLEELCFHNTCDISEELINKIASCFKLRTFEISIKSTSENFQNIEIKGIERIATLEGLVLKGIDLTSENGIQFSSCKQLHTLKLSFCQVNDKSLYRIENLKFLKTLDVLYLKKKTS